MKLLDGLLGLAWLAFAWWLVINYPGPRMLIDVLGLTGVGFFVYWKVNGRKGK